ncbi:hypothetical protein GCM10011428_48890 [Streptomyces violaceus]
MQTLVIPIVPELPRYLDASPSNAAWAITATLLAAAVATPVVGRLGDMFGKRRMLLVSVVLLVSGSVVCALSDSLVPMIVGRTLQGLAAAVVPLGISIMRDVLSAERLAGSTALMSASLGVGGALGLPAAAFIADHYDWHMLFWISAALGVVALALLVLIVPESKVRTGGHADGPDEEPDAAWLEGATWQLLTHQLAVLAALALPGEDSAVARAAVHRPVDVARGFVRAVRRRDWRQAAGAGRWLTLLDGVPRTLGLENGLDFVELMGGQDPLVALQVRAARLTRTGAFV